MTEQSKDDTPECVAAQVHTVVRDIFQRAEQDTQQQVQALLNRYRHEGDWQQVAIKRREEIDDLRAARRNYAQTLTDIRRALGALDDADLVEVARKTMHVIEQTDLFRQQHIAERDRALAECERLRAGIALARAYKAAVDGLNGVADAEAALFAWLEGSCQLTVA